MDAPVDIHENPGGDDAGISGVALVLSAVAGYIDVLGWLLLSHVYVANMSGNTIALGRALARGNFGGAVAFLWPIAMFALGLFTSEVVCAVARHRGRASSAGWALGIEAAAIAFVAILPWPAAASTSGIIYYLPTGLLALAMGLQNATLVRVGASSVYTTHMTGNLAQLVREGTDSLLGLGEHLASAAPRRSLRCLLLRAVQLVAYGAGALFGACAADRWGRLGALAGVVVLTALVAFDAFEPIGGHAHANAKQERLSSA